MEYRRTARIKRRAPGPPDRIVACVEALLCGPEAERIARDLRTRHPQAAPYIYHSAIKIVAGIAGGIVKGFDFKKVFGEAFALFFIAFWGAPLQPRIAVTVIALIVLRVRDAYVYYLIGSAGDAATDGLVMTAIVALSQVYLLRAYPPAVMPALPMVQGLAVGMMLVAFWRLLCQLQTPFQNLQKRSEFRVFSSALRINCMFFVASGASLLAGIAAVPDTGQVRDHVLGAALPFLLFLVLLFKKNVMGSLLWAAPWSILTNPIQEEAERKQDALPTPLPVKPTYGMIIAMRFQTIALLMIGAPVGIAVWRLVTHSPQPVQWPLVAMNFVAWIALVFLWTKIKQLNLRAVKAMKVARLG